MDLREFADRYNELTGLFLRKFGAETGEGNLVFSPFSILSLLSILADATGGTSRKEVADLLYGSLPRQGFPEQLKAVREELTRKNNVRDYAWLDSCEDPFNGKPICDRSEHFHSANAVCVRDDIQGTVRPEFQKRLREMYDGVLLSSSSPGTVLQDWMSEMMCDEMRPLLEEVLSSGSLMAMVNTVFFDAMWQYPFEGEDIETGIFHNADGTASRVFMLHGGADYYVENDLAAGFVKHFQQCGYSFMALLPRKEGPEGLRELMDAVDFRALAKEPRHVILHSMFPEFNISFMKDMKEIIRALGIREVFTGCADFSSVSTAQLMAEKMIHQAKIEVNRNGARASAATVLTCYGACPPEDEKFVMIDRPFAFAIIHEEQDIPVFAGVVNHLENV